MHKPEYWYYCLLIYLPLIMPQLIMAQSTRTPSISDIEANVGFIQLTPELLVENELSRLEQALQTEDSTAFADGFDDTITGNRIGLNSLMQELAGLVVRAMRKRNNTLLDSVALPGAFDFTIRDIELDKRPNKIRVDAVLEFTFLTVPKIKGRDTTYTPFTRSITADYKIKKKRWKIKSSSGIIDFFLDSILLAAPGDKTYKSSLRKFESLRTGNPKGESELFQGGAQ